ncbi:MAG: LPS export ABC transporter periplasmic protein LptC, partial [Gemmatimonadetes bacterium]|nr:LPS export ABC transporter periplasmic protein LptC [Gemmatimonadota bacterium]
VVWEFRGELLRYYENPERVEADGLIIDFYENEKYSTTLTADHGTMERGSSDMHATGNVVIENVEGTRVETESIQYQDEQERIFTDDFVTILRGNKKITGYGLETDPELNETLIKRDVVAKTIDRSR